MKTTADHLRELFDAYQYSGNYLIAVDPRIILSLSGRKFVVTANKIKPACENCGGTGKEFVISRDEDESVERTCPVCNGNGFV